MARLYLSTLCPLTQALFCSLTHSCSTRLAYICFCVLFCSSPQDSCFVFVFYSVQALILFCSARLYLVLFGPSLYLVLFGLHERLSSIPASVWFSSTFTNDSLQSPPLFGALRPSRTVLFGRCDYVGWILLVFYRILVLKYVILSQQEVELPDVVKELMEANPELSMTMDPSNTPALHTAATQVHIEIVKFLLEAGSSLATIAKSNGKMALYSATRNGHMEVVKALLEQDICFTTRTDKKEQTTLHMAVKGQSVEVVEELIRADPSSINMVETKGNTTLHIATRKNRTQIVKMLLEREEINRAIINKSGETALDTAEKMCHQEMKGILAERCVKSAKTMAAPPSARELK